MGNVIDTRRPDCPLRVASAATHNLGLSGATCWEKYVECTAEECAWWCDSTSSCGVAAIDRIIPIADLFDRKQRGTL